MKRLLDIIGAVLGLVLFAPIIAVAALAIRATMGAPVLFGTVRPGWHGIPFKLHKLRTMRPPTALEPPVSGPLSDEFRLTRLGRILRKTSIDELPQLWNVLRGDMSLIGPRPLLTEYLSLYTPEQARRHDVRPGITGWAQVHGRNALPWKERLLLDVWYVDHRSLFLDLKIVAMTLKHLVVPAGIFFPAGANTLKSHSRTAMLAGKETS